MEPLMSLKSSAVGNQDEKVESSIMNDWNSIPDELWVEIFEFYCDSFRSVLIDVPSISKRFYDLVSPPKLDHLMKAFQKCTEQQDSSEEVKCLDDTASDKVSGWRKFFSFGKKKQQQQNEVTIVENENNTQTPPEKESVEEIESAEMIKQLEKEFMEMCMECVNTEGDALYGRLLALQELTDFKDLVSKHGSLRAAFIQSVIDGIKINPEKCFRRELIYHASHIFKTEEEYRSFIDNQEGEINIQNHESKSCGCTILMTEDYSSSSAGLNLVANPIYYDTGVKFYEFRVHKSGRYDNYLIGLCLTEVLDLSNMLKKTYEQGDMLSSRFLLVDKKNYDLKFYDYFGSSNSIGWAYYNEGITVYNNGGSFNPPPSFHPKLSYPCDVTGCEYVLGVYFDTKNLRLVFAKNGSLSSNGYDLKNFFKKHPKFKTRQLALYPCLSMGHRNDAVTFESRIPLTTMVTVRNLVKQVKFD